jgi:hypothetical protein
MRAETALLTQKGGPGLTVRLFAMSTLATGTAGVARVYQFHLDTCPGSLVVDKHAELVESPGMPFVSIATSNIQGYLIFLERLE